MTVNRRQLLARAAAGLAGLALEAEAAPTPARRPNVVVILADDLGWMDTSTYGSRFYETPNITRLARGGMLFRNAYAANPLCSPTRASVLTGQYPCRLRLTTPAGHLREVVLDPKLPARAGPDQPAVTPGTRTRLPLEEVTLAESLKMAGYATAHFGKWHLGWAPYEPDAQGFDVSFPGGSYPGPPSYLAPYRMQAAIEAPPGEHIDDRLVAEAERFIESHRDSPFYINFWPFSVHAPFQAKPDLIESYRGKVQLDNPQRSPIMGAMVRTLDDVVGKLMAALDRAGVADNTVVFFISDNGGNMYSRPDGVTPTSNYPLRGGKATIYEGGTRVPWIVVWPGAVRPGTESDAIVSTIDVCPTVLEMTRVHPAPGRPMDGESIVPVLRKRARLKRKTLFCHFPHYVPATGNLPSVWVRRGDWKLIRFFCDGPGQKDRFELYNLREDIGEQHDRSTDHPEMVRELDRLIDRHLADTKALVPIPNPLFGRDDWFGNAQAEVSLLPDGALLKSSGNDPFMTIGLKAPLTEPSTVEIRMKSSSTGAAQFFWATREKPAFARERCVFFDPQHDGQWHNYRIAIPNAGVVASFRFDPCAAPGEVRIAHIRVLDGAGKLLREWAFDRPNPEKPGK
jgi:arylsulfatase A-like enzyme